MESVSHHGREIAYTNADGTGPPVCYIHGSGTDHRVWNAQRARSSRPAVTLDLSGHGDSTDIDAEAGYESLSAYADDVLAVIEATDSEAVIANSLGGAVALHLLIERDVAPSALVLCGTGAKLAVIEDLRTWLAEDFERAIDFLHQPDRLFHDPADAVARQSKATMRETGRTITCRDFETCHRFDVRDRLGEIETPTLAVCGEHDQLTPPRYHEYLATNIPNAERATVSDAAHLSMIERADVFHTVVEEFLDSTLE